MGRAFGRFDKSTVVNRDELSVQRLEHPSILLNRCARLPPDYGPGLGCFWPGTGPRMYLTAKIINVLLAGVPVDPVAQIFPFEWCFGRRIIVGPLA